MELHDKLLEVSRLFRIDYEYLGYETIQMGNVNHTYKVNFRLPEGGEKSFLVQNVNTYAHPGEEAGEACPAFPSHRRPENLYCRWGKLLAHDQLRAFRHL